MSIGDPSISGQTERLLNEAFTFYSVRILVLPPYRKAKTNGELGATSSKGSVHIGGLKCRDPLRSLRDEVSGRLLDYGIVPIYRHKAITFTSYE